MTKVPESLAALFYDFVSSVKDNDVLIGIAVDELSRLDKTIQLVTAVGALQRLRGEDTDDADPASFVGRVTTCKGTESEGVSISAWFGGDRRLERTRSVR